MVREKLRIILFATLLLVAISPIHSYAATWNEFVYDAEIPLITRENLAKAVDVTDNLLTKYKIDLRHKISIVVTADTEGYIQALMLYAKKSRAKAEEYAKAGGAGDRHLGSSIKGEPIIIIRGSRLRIISPNNAVKVLSHEIFHQAQNQGRAVKSELAFLSEGSAELFQLEALETAGVGIGTSDYYINYWCELVIREAPAIPDARMLADQENLRTMTQQGYPTYEMSVVMAYRLVKDTGFESIILYYELLQNGTDPDKAFLTAFRVPIASFLSDTNAYFIQLRGKH